MHAAYARSSGTDGDAIFYARLPERRSEIPAEAPPPPLAPIGRSVYGARSRPSWSGILLIVALHAVALAAMLSYKAVYNKPAKKAPLVVELLSLPKPPPPPAAEPPSETPPRETPSPVTEMVVPPRVVEVAAPAAPIVAAPPPPAPKTAAPAAPAPVTAAGPVSVADLSSKMVTGKPPKYPIESRRKREQGTVVLSVLVGIDGAVAEVDVSRSSGFERLDKAALEAVRRWRWSPTLRDGQPVYVRGYVDIPFVLAG